MFNLLLLKRKYERKPTSYIKSKDPTLLAVELLTTLGFHDPRLAAPSIKLWSHGVSTQSSRRTARDTALPVGRVQLREATPKRRAKFPRLLALDHSPERGMDLERADPGSDPMKVKCFISSTIILQDNPPPRKGEQMIPEYGWNMSSLDRIPS